MAVMIPRHVKAKTAADLEKIMSFISRTTGFEKITFSNIQNVDGLWYVWYLASDDDLNKISTKDIGKEKESK